MLRQGVSACQQDSAVPDLCLRGCETAANALVGVLAAPETAANALVLAAEKSGTNAR